MDYRKLRQIDFDHIWHPFTQSSVWTSDDEPLIIERGEGVELIDTEGNRYLDGVSSLWANVHGHGVPELISALKEQTGKLCHSTLLGLSHNVIIELTEKLMRLVPKNLNRAFYADSGTTAVEAGLRIAVEYWQKQTTAKKKTRFASLEGAYHGDTLGAVGVGYLEVFHHALKDSVVPALRVSPPHLYRVQEGLSEGEALEKSVSELQAFFKTHADSLAAFIVEPLVQGAAGIWIHPPEYLKEIEALCRAHDVLLIADEVATGFAKTGKMFAVEHADVNPDIMILGKGLSAGYLPISVALTTEDIFSAFSGKPEELKTFFYGQTFAGNPLAARVATANLDLMSKETFFPALRECLLHFQEELKNLIEPLNNVSQVRNLGVMTGIELTKTPGAYDPFPVSELVGPRIVWQARKEGVVIRPLGNVIVLMPPLVMKEEDLSRLVSVTAEAIRGVCSK